MTLLQTIRAFFVAWTDSVAAGIVAALDRIVSPRVVRLVENENDEFSVEAAGKSGHAPLRAAFADGALTAPGLAPVLKGSRVEILLQSKRFLFRPLELPARAADFLDGIVRAQIDRLTPWSANDAVFGCSRPVAAGPESIATVIAAGTRKVAQSYVGAVSEFHPSAVAIFTHVDDDKTNPVKVYEQKARGLLDAASLGRALLVVLAVAVTSAVLSMLAAAYVADSIGSQESEIARQIAQRRSVIRTGDAQDRSPLAELERRKHDMPASVIVLDALTQVLPDHTYVSELHIQGNRIQIVGITRDAPSLISSIELSPYFTRATFYAPTTRALSDPGERFHIEAQVRGKDAQTP